MTNKAIKFKQANADLRDEDGNVQLHYFYDPNSGQVITKWRIGFIDRVRFLFTGRLWLSVITDNTYLPPMGIFSDFPFEPPAE